MNDQDSYWVITSRAKGGANSPFGGNATSNQTSQLVQMTEDQIRQEYQDSGQLQDKFGSFDGYMGYINDSQDFVQSAEWMTATPEYKTGSKEWAFLNGEDLAWGPGERERIQEKIIQDRVAARTSAFEQWMGGEAGSALMQKYGIEPEILNNDGDKFKWTGSGYQKTYKVDDHAGVADYVKMGIVSALGAAATPAIAGALGGIGGGALPAGVAKGLAAGATNAATQGLLTGSIDPKSLLSSAVVSGINPGGMLSDKFGAITKTGKNLVADNVVGGFVSGAGNSAVSQLITDGGVGLQETLLAGGMGAGKNVIKDLFSDTDQFSVESEMRRIELERQMQGLPPLSTSDLYDEAMFGNMTGRSDLAGLVGEDGLLSFIPTVKTGGLNRLLGNGILDPNSIFTGPDGKKYTDIEVLQMGKDPAAIYFGEVDGWKHSLSSTAGKNINFEQGGFLNALAEKEFENNYGVTPTDFMAGGGTVDQLKQMMVYGPLDESYNWSENPRGDSQYVGLLTGLEGSYTTGSLNDQRQYQAPVFVDPNGNQYLEEDLLSMGIKPSDVIDGKVAGWSQIYRGIQDALDITNYQEMAANAPDPNSGSVAIINLGNGETAVNANATLSGSNTTLLDAITQGIIDGVLVANSDDTSNSNAGSNASDTNANENAVSTDSTLAGTDTNTSANENTVSTDKTLAGDETNANENTASTNKTLTGSNASDTSANENTASTNKTLTGGNENVVNTNKTLTGGNENTVNPNKTLTGGNENAVNPADNLPSGGSNNGGLGIPTGGRGWATPEWTDLYGYTKISPYKKARLKVLAGMLSGIPGVSMDSLALSLGSEEDPYRKIGMSDWDSRLERNA